VDDRTAIADEIASETLAMQAGGWVAAYYKAAQGLKNAKDAKEIAGIISEYNSAMAQKGRGYYSVPVVVGRKEDGDYKIGIAKRQVNVTLTDDQLKRYRELLLPGITGDASKDFARILNSEWGRSIPEGTRKLILDQIQQPRSQSP
jgi:hypothetical protein